MADNATVGDPSSSSSSTLPAASSDTQPNTQPSSNPASQPMPSSDETAAGLDIQQDRDLDAEINLSSAPDRMNAATSADSSAPTAANAGAVANTAAAVVASAAQAPESAGADTIPPLIEPRIPQKKDTSLREFLGKMDDYAPLIPDAVTDYYLTVAGLPPPPDTDRRLARLLALATQKFIADIAADAYQYSRIRSTNTTSNNPLTGLGGAAGFGTSAAQTGEGGEGGAGKGAKKDTGRSQPLGGPRAGYGGGGSGGQGRTVLTMEDLGMAVGEYGVNVKRGEFYR